MMIIIIGGYALAAMMHGEYLFRTTLCITARSKPPHVWLLNHIFVLKTKWNITFKTCVYWRLNIKFIGGRIYQHVCNVDPNQLRGRKLIGPRCTSQHSDQICPHQVLMHCTQYITDNYVSIFLILAFDFLFSDLFGNWKPRPQTLDWRKLEKSWLLTFSLFGFLSLGTKRRPLTFW